MKDCNTPVTILYAEKGSVEFYKKMGFEHFSNGMYRLKQ
jgi:predicted acetyltransferase